MWNRASVSGPESADSIAPPSRWARYGGSAVRHWVDDLTIRSVRETVNPVQGIVQGIVTAPPSHNSVPKPRAGGVHASRPVPRPGRSNAESMDADEHGVTMSDAMAVQLLLLGNERRIHGDDYASNRASCLTARESVSSEETRSATRVVVTVFGPIASSLSHAPPRQERRMFARRSRIAEAGHAWRERPPHWPLAWQGKGSKQVVAHAMGWLLSTVPTAAPRGGRHRAPPEGNSIEVAASRGLAVRTLGANRPREREM